MFLSLLTLAYQTRNSTGLAAKNWRETKFIRTCKYNQCRDWMVKSFKSNPTVEKQIFPFVNPDLISFYRLEKVAKPYITNLVFLKFSPFHSLSTILYCQHSQPLYRQLSLWNGFKVAEKVKSDKKMFCKILKSPREIFKSNFTFPGASTKELHMRLSLESTNKRQSWCGSSLWLPQSPKVKKSTSNQLKESTNFNFLFKNSNLLLDPQWARGCTSISLF